MGRPQQAQLIGKAGFHGNSSTFLAEGQADSILRRADTLHSKCVLASK